MEKWAEKKWLFSEKMQKNFVKIWIPNLVHQHWVDKGTQKCPNMYNFDWDCVLAEF